MPARNGNATLRFGLSGNALSQSLRWRHFKPHC
jgi:hypothetical protein